MGLVDYSSDSDSGPDPGPVPARPTPGADLPPLPAAFHDLYASTVRQSVVDDPSLHQGRRRVTPHVVGNWPSHVYVEWRPPQPEHDALSLLVNKARERLGRGRRLSSLLESDLGAPLPLHVSLSRPLALTTEQKDDFLARVEGAIRGCGVLPLTVSPTALRFFKSPDSPRTFLVLKVHPSSPSRPNPLATLLQKCNATASHFSLPLLYAHAAGVDEAAFHISLAWTLDEVGDDTGWTMTLLEESGVKGWGIPVEGVKVKIGNVVTNVPLGPPSESRALFG